MGFLKKLFGGEKQPVERPSEQSTPQNKEYESDGSRGNAILDFHGSIHESIEWGQLEDVEFAMWLPAEKDPRFTESPMVERWNAVYAITKDYWSYIAADILQNLGEIDENTMRIGLPENFQAFAFLTGQDEQVVFSVSQEKGIRFHFSGSTDLEYRLEFMDRFITYCKAWKSLLAENGGEKDEDLGFDQWWKNMVKVSTGIEEKEPLTGVGKIVK
ncbi:MAG: hypothetical protein ACO1N0_10645 [Fluviicola sp.]